MFFLSAGILNDARKPVSAQDTVPIAADPPECTVQLTETLQLGSLDDPGTVGLFSSVLRTPTGQFILASQDNDGEVLVYDPDGNFVRSFGRQGSGPAEFRTPGRLRPGPDGSTFILDAGNQRIARVSPDWTVLELFPVGSVRALDFVPLDPRGGFVVSGFGEGGGRLVAQTEVIDSSEATRIALEAMPVDPWVVSFHRAPVTIDAEGRVWSVGASQYAFSRWIVEDDGGADIRLEGHPAWFDGGPPQPGAPVSGVPSVIADLSVADGFLWAITWVSDQVGPKGIPENAGSSELDVIQSILDTVIEVIDPISGKLVARTVDGRVLTLTGDGKLLFEVREVGGVPRVVLYDMTLIGGECR